MYVDGCRAAPAHRRVHAERRRRKSRIGRRAPGDRRVKNGLDVDCGHESGRGRGQSMLSARRCRAVVGARLRVQGGSSRARRERMAARTMSIWERREGAKALNRRPRMKVHWSSQPRAVRAVAPGSPRESARSSSATIPPSSTCRFESWRLALLLPSLLASHSWSTRLHPHSLYRASSAACCLFPVGSIETLLAPS
jgi:hypothetical protein